MKKCNKCKVEKELIDFGKWAEGKDGLCLYCKSCVSKDRKEFLEKNKLRIYADRKKQAQKNPEARRISAKKSYEKHKKERLRKVHDYNEKNRDKINEKQKIYYSKNRVKINIKESERLATDEGRRKSNEYYHNTKEKFDIKIKARNKLRYAVKVRNLIKPEKCEKCFEKRKLDGHHEDYSKPLEVTWVCSLCHKKIHKQGELTCI